MIANFKVLQSFWKLNQYKKMQEEEFGIVFYPSTALQRRLQLIQQGKKKEIFFFSLETEDLLYLIFEYSGISSIVNILTTCKYWFDLFYRKEELDKLFILQAFRLFFFIQKGYPCIQFPSISFISEQYLNVFKQYPKQIDWYTIQPEIWDCKFFKVYQQQIPLLEKCFESLLLKTSNFSFAPQSIQRVIEGKHFIDSNETVHHFNILDAVSSFMFYNLLSRDVSFFEYALIHPIILSKYTLYLSITEDLLNFLIQRGVVIGDARSKITEHPQLKELILSASTSRDRSIINYESNPDCKLAILDYIKHASDSYSFFDPKVKKNKFYVKNLIYYHPRMIFQMPPNERTKDLILIALSRDGMLLENFSKAEQKSIECVEAAVRSHADAFQFAREKLRSDKDLILFLLKEQPKILKYVNPTILQERDFVMQCIKVNPNSFEFLLPEHKNDLTIVKHCLSYNPMLLEFVGIALKNNLHIVQIATVNYTKPFQFAGLYFAFLCLLPLIQPVCRRRCEEK